MKGSNTLILEDNSLTTVTHLLNELETVPVNGDAEKMVLQVLGESIAYSNGLISGIGDDDIDGILEDLGDGFSE